MRFSKLVLALAVLAVVQAGSAATDLEVNVQSIQPNPATPGQTVDVSVVVRNDGDDSGTFGPVDVETVDGVSYAGTTSSLNEEFTLCGGCQQIGKLFLEISPSQASGNYPLEVAVPSDDLRISQELVLEVDGTAVLSATSVEAKAAQGEPANTTFRITNVGTDTASSALMELRQPGFSVSPSTTPLGDIEPGETAEASVTLTPDEDQDSGTRQLNFSVGYTEDASRLSTSLGGTVNVLDSADLVLDEFDAEDLTLEEQSDVSVEVENLGPGTADSISMSMSCEGAGQGSETAFVGELEDGESIPATFPVSPSSEEVSCELTVDYSDSEQRSFTRTSSFTASETSSSLPVVLVVLALIGAAGFFLYRRRKSELEQV